MRFVQEISQRVLVTLIAVAIQLAQRLRLHVLPVVARTIVSELIAIVITHALVSFTKVNAAQIGYATDALAGIVHILAVVSADG